MRTVDIFFNQRTMQETDASGRQVSQITRLKLFEKALLRPHALDDSGNPVALAAGLTFSYGLDRVPTAARTGTPPRPDLVASNNASFLSTDWPASGNDGWNLSLGQICCRVSLAPSALAADLATISERQYQHVIWAYPASDDPFPFMVLPVWVDNVDISPGNTTEPDTPDAYVTVAMLAQMLSIPAGKQLVVNPSTGAITVVAITS